MSAFYRLPRVFTAVNLETNENCRFSFPDEQRFDFGIPTDATDKEAIAIYDKKMTKWRYCPSETTVTRDDNSITFTSICNYMQMPTMRYKVVCTIEVG